MIRSSTVSALLLSLSFLAVQTPLFGKAKAFDPCADSVSTTSARVTLARPSDAVSIYNLAQLLLQQPDRDQRQTGFLLGRFSPEDFAEFARQKRVLIAKADSRVVGFTIVMDSSDTDLDDYAYAMKHAEFNIPRESIGPFKWIEQSGVDPSYKGVGKALYEEILRRYPDHALLGEVVTHPTRNERSIGFHEKLGGKIIAIFSAKSYPEPLQYDESVIFYLPAPEARPAAPRKAA